MSENENINVVDIYNFQPGDRVVVDYSPTWAWQRPWYYRDGAGQLIPSVSFPLGASCVILGKDYNPSSGLPKPNMWLIERPYNHTDIFSDAKHRTTGMHQCWLRPWNAHVVPYDEKQEKFWNQIILNVYLALGRPNMHHFVARLMSVRQNLNPGNVPGHPVYNSQTIPQIWLPMIGERCPANSGRTTNLI